MSSSDKIVVASSRRKGGFPRDSEAPASPTKGERREVPGQQTTKSPSADTPVQSEAAAVTAASSLDLGSEGSSSPLSEVDEEVLDKAPTVKLRELAFGINSPTSLPSSPPSIGAAESTPSSDSLPKPLSSARSIRQRPSDMTNTEPPVKRRRGRPRKNAPKEVKVEEDKGKEIKDEFALDLDLDHRTARPRQISTLDHESSDSPATRVAARATAKAKAQLAIDGDFDSFGKLGRRAAGKLVEKEKEKYEPLHLYEDSNWVLFDCNKGFPADFGEPPSMFRRFERYESGNTRILEFNLASHSVRMKCTPKALKGKVVRYGEMGPRFESCHSGT